jgi:hypothetical protein
MNKDQIKKCFGHRVRIRPIPKSFEGSKEVPADDDWIITRVNADHLELKNIRSDHVAILGLDNIHNYLSEPGRNQGETKYGFLWLRVQISLVV